MCFPATPAAPRCRRRIPRSRRFPFGVALLALLALWSWPGESRAWIERRVDSCTTFVELDREGVAVVRWEIGLRVRGARLRQFTLRGVDDDATALSDATITRIDEGRAVGPPVAARIEVKDGTLLLSAGGEKGVRGRHLLLRFAYRTNLADRGLLRFDPQSGRQELAWVGPRFDDGVDSVTVVFRLPAGSKPPQVVEVDEVRAENFGIVTSSLRRSERRDELELVRAHVGKREPVTWQVALDASTLPAGERTGSEAADGGPEFVAHPSPARVPPWERSALLGGVAYAILILLKSHWVQRASAARNARSCGWVDCHVGFRAVLGGVALAGAAFLVLELEAPLPAALSLLVALAAAAHRAPLAQSVLRGPGEWVPISADALRRTRSASLPGAWLDVGRLPGFLVGMGLVGTVAWLSSGLFETSPFRGACLLLGSTALLPVFCTGRASELPPDHVAESRCFLGHAHRRLTRRKDLLVTPRARRSGAKRVDELRLWITPTGGAEGLLGLELGVEYDSGAFGLEVSPVVVVRAADGSAAYRKLPPGPSWTRGRKSEERALLLRPRLPTVGMAIALVVDLSRALTAQSEGPVRSRRNAAKSSGRGLSTAKASTAAPPVHAT